MCMSLSGAMGWLIYSYFAGRLCVNPFALHNYIRLTIFDGVNKNLIKYK